MLIDGDKTKSNGPFLNSSCNPNCMFEAIFNVSGALPSLPPSYCLPVAATVLSVTRLCVWLAAGNG